MERPEIKTLNDIVANKEAILTYCHNNPLADWVYHIHIPVDSEKEDPDQIPKWVVAGSAALHRFLELLHNTVIHNVGFPGVQERNIVVWNPYDIDVWLLNTGINVRIQGSTIDLIFTEAKTPSDIILEFDLPPSKVAYHNNEFWISSQALTCIFTRKYSLPQWIKYENTMKQVLELSIDKPVSHKHMKFVFERIDSRIKKYQSRGFNVEWIDQSQLDQNSVKSILSCIGFLRQYQTSDQRAKKREEAISSLPPSHWINLGLNCKHRVIRSVFFGLGFHILSQSPMKEEQIELLWSDKIKKLMTEDFKNSPKHQIDNLNQPFGCQPYHMGLQYFYLLRNHKADEIAAMMNWSQLEIPNVRGLATREISVAYRLISLHFIRGKESIDFLLRVRNSHILIGKHTQTLFESYLLNALASLYKFTENMKRDSETFQFIFDLLTYIWDTVMPNIDGISTDHKKEVYRVIKSAYFRLIILVLSSCQKHLQLPTFFGEYLISFNPKLFQKGVEFLNELHRKNRFQYIVLNDKSVQLFKYYLIGFYSYWTQQLGDRQIDRQGDNQLLNMVSTLSQFLSSIQYQCYKDSKITDVEKIGGNLNLSEYVLASASLRLSNLCADYSFDHNIVLAPFFTTTNDGYNLDKTGSHTKELPNTVMELVRSHPDNKDYVICLLSLIKKNYFNRVEYLWLPPLSPGINYLNKWMTKTEHIPDVKLQFQDGTIIETSKILLSNMDHFKVIFELDPSLNTIKLEKSDAISFNILISILNGQQISGVSDLIRAFILSDMYSGDDLVGYLFFQILDDLDQIKVNDLIEVYNRKQMTLNISRLEQIYKRLITFDPLDAREFLLLTSYFDDVKIYQATTKDIGVSSCESYMII